MLPFEWRLGGFVLGPEQLFVLLAILTSAVVVRPRVKPFDLAAGDLLDLALVALAGGAVGAKLFYMIPLWIRGTESASELAASWSSGSAFYGGFILASAGVMTLLRVKGKPVLAVSDAIATVFPIGFGIGKIGCFLAGCCYGRRCEGFPGLHYAPHSLAYDTQRKAGQIASTATEALPVHPVPLYDILFSSVMALVLVQVWRRSKRPGETLLAWVAGYSAWRFLIEFLRDDPDRHLFGAAVLSDSQIAAGVLLLFSAAAWIRMRRNAVAA